MSFRNIIYRPFALRNRQNITLGDKITIAECNILQILYGSGFANDKCISSRVIRMLGSLYTSKQIPREGIVCDENYSRIFLADLKFLDSSMLFFAKIRVGLSCGFGIAKYFLFWGSFSL